MIASRTIESDKDFIAQLLDEQQHLTAVEKFAQLHAACEFPLRQSSYRDLIPLTKPGLHEQYAFEVDLDACSGCKACVAACHSLNGLEETETWRSVGLLHGGSSELPVLQHITTACHHCIDPGCLQGCPVNAYEKDEVTGIVRHLDDQCIGCKYCTFMCPYDVPKYSHKKGIVRKCDMCHDRLAVGEAPACVQACPNKAIQITIVNQQRIVEESEANLFLPGSPEPSQTLPSTVYKTNRVFPRNLLPADYFSARPQHAHWPLVLMLVFTQMSVGAFAVEQFMAMSSLWTEKAALARLVHLGSALALGLFGMHAALFHLGRPLYAFRAIIGLRRSWLSREILMFGLFPAAAGLYAAAAGSELTGISIGPELTKAAGYLAAAIGLLAVFCSMRIYVVTKRPFWNTTFTFTKFFGTAAVLGLPLALLISSLGSLVTGEQQNTLAAFGRPICWSIIVATLLKLGLESLVFVSLHERSFTPLKRSAYLLMSDLGLTTLKRYFFGIVGGLALPATLLVQTAGDNQVSWLFIATVVFLSFVMLLVGEIFERYLFFAAVVAPKMPGVVAT